MFIRDPYEEFIRRLFCSMADDDGEGDGNGGAGGASDDGSGSGAGAGAGDGGDAGGDGAGDAVNATGQEGRGLLGHATGQGGEGDGDGDGKGGQSAGDGDGTGDGEDDKTAGKLTFKDKPDWLASNFYDKKTGEVKVEELAKSQRDLREKLSRGEHKPPESPDGYKFEIPDDLKDIADRALITDQETLDYLGVEQDPLVDWFQHWCHDRGLSQEDFQTGVHGFLQGARDWMPEPPDPVKEIKALGPKGQAIINNNEQFRNHLQEKGILTQKEAERVDIWMQTAADVSAFNKIRQWYGEAEIPYQAPAASGAKSREDLRAEMAKVTSQAEYDRLMKEYERTYGDEPAGTSLPG